MSETNGNDNPVDLDDDREPGEQGKRRSGASYPWFNLEDALGFARGVRERGGSEMREEDLLVALNLSRSTKSWIYKLSSAREFGLVQKQGRKGEARIVLTDLAKKLLLPGDEQETQAAKIAAFMSPQLYQKLYDRYKGAPVPIADRLANVLHRDFDLLESVAPAAAQAFIESARYAGLVTAANHIAPRLPSGPEPPVPPPPLSQPEARTETSQPAAPLPVPERAGMQQM
jgi:hypothetical protein